MKAVLKLLSTGVDLAIVLAADHEIGKGAPQPTRNAKIWTKLKSQL